jgi:hypothetical protein
MEGQRAKEKNKIIGGGNKVGRRQSRKLRKAVIKKQPTKIKIRGKRANREREQVRK